MGEAKLTNDNGTRKKAYLAGPDVFHADVYEVFREKIALCAEYEFEVVLPGDAQMGAQEDPVAHALRIYSSNIDAMNRADFGIFNLTPFRGPGADGGTVFELGYMTGRGKKLFGYTNVTCNYIDRIGLKTKDAEGDKLHDWRDENDQGIEDFGLADNVMIDRAILAGGTALIREPAGLPERFRALGGFRDCLIAARAHFGASS